MTDKEKDEREDLLIQTRTGLVIDLGELMGPSKDDFDLQLEETLRQAEQEFRRVGKIASTDNQQISWQIAREVVEGFKPVPSFVWRISNYVFGRADQIAVINEGIVFGLRRLMFAAASDPVLGIGKKVNNMRNALEILPSDVAAAVSVIHAVARRLKSSEFERIWRPILEDAVIRAQIGFYIGQMRLEFGPGRGMLAGFAGRCGLTVLIASGTLEQARRALELLAAGESIGEVGTALYDCDPLQVSAMILSAAGCGRDAAFGTIAYASDDPLNVVKNETQKCWYAAFAIAEMIRVGKIAEIPTSLWEVLNFHNDQEKEELKSLVKLLVRRGHGWNWLV